MDANGEHGAAHAGAKGIVLERRARFLAAALASAGIVTGSACGEKPPATPPTFVFTTGAPIPTIEEPSPSATASASARR